MQVESEIGEAGPRRVDMVQHMDAELAIGTALRIIEEKMPNDERLSMAAALLVEAKTRVGDYSANVERPLVYGFGTISEILGKRSQEDKDRETEISESCLRLSDARHSIESVARKLRAGGRGYEPMALELEESAKDIKRETNAIIFPIVANRSSTVDTSKILTPQAGEEEAVTRITIEVRRGLGKLSTTDRIDIERSGALNAEELVRSIPSLIDALWK